MRNVRPARLLAIIAVGLLSFGANAIQSSDGSTGAGEIPAARASESQAPGGSVLGDITRVRGALIEGWACDPASPGTAVEVRATSRSGQLLAKGRADRTLTGLAVRSKQCGSDAHGFAITIPPAAHSCAEQDLNVVALPAAGGSAVALASGLLRGAFSQPPEGELTLVALTPGDKPRMQATFNPAASGSVRSVNWFDGATEIGRTNRSPHAIEWTPARSGQLSVLAVATDDCGNTTRATASFDAFNGTRVPPVRLPSVSFAETGEGRSYFTVGNLPLRIEVIEGAHPINSVRLFYSADAGTANPAYLPIAALEAPFASKMYEAWPLPRPPSAKAWDGRYAFVVEVEDAGGLVGTARIELPIAPPTYSRIGTDDAMPEPARSSVPLFALFSFSGPGVEAAEEARAAADIGGTDGPVTPKAGTVPVTVNVSGAGTISSNPAGSPFPCTATCTGSVYSNADPPAVTLTATPAAGQVFVGWFGGPCTGVGACVLSGTSAQSVSARFVPRTDAPGGILPVTLDIDANSRLSALTDGLLAIRWMFGLTGSSVTTNAIGSGALRATPAAVESYLSSVEPVLDIDGNGAITPLTDGLLIQRYLFGLRGASLTEGAVAPNASRSAAAIESYLSSPCQASFVPPGLSLSQPGPIVLSWPPSTLTLTATPSAVSIPLCPITRVVFTSGAAYPDGTVLGTASAAPYSIQWTPESTGNNWLFATAIHVTATGLSFPVVTAAGPLFRVVEGPAITLAIVPTSTNSFSLSATAIVNAPASSIASVQFVHGDGVPIPGTPVNTNGVWTLAWNNVPPGSYSVTARVTDNTNAVKSSEPVTAVVNATPGIAIKGPLEGALIRAGTDVAITAVASDADDGVAQVDFYAGSTLLGTRLAPDSGTRNLGEWSFTWPAVAAGTYSLSARARDLRNASATSTAVQVSITAPQQGAQSLVRYSYDAVGNIRTIQRSTPLTLAGFSTESGPAGATIFIFGSGFSTTTGANAVVFGGNRQATVVAASANQLTVLVPAAATTGLVSVTVGGVTSTSASPFVVTQTYGEPTITGVAPGCGSAGTLVGVSGRNFNPAPGATQTSVGSAAASASVANSNTLSFTIPATAGTGLVSVSTSGGNAQSMTPLLVVAAPLACSDFPATPANLPVGGSTVVPIAAGKKAAVAFSAQARSSLSFHAAGVVTTPAAQPVSYVLYGTNNAVLASGTRSGAAFSIHLPSLPATGTYLLVLSAPAGATASVPIALQSDAAMAVDGAEVALSGIAAGQSRRVSFAGVFGQALGVGGTNVSGNLSLTYLRPNGTTLFTSSWSGNASDDLPVLADNGTFTLVVAAAGTAGQATLRLSSDVLGTLAIDGPPAALRTIRPGQNGRFTFAIAQATSAAVVISANTFAGALVQLRRPDGTVQASLSVGSSSGEIPLQPLASAGTYTVFVSGTGARTGSMQIAVARPDLVISAINSVSSKARTGGGFDIVASFSGRNSGTAGARGVTWYDLAYLGPPGAPLADSNQNLSGSNPHASTAVLGAGQSYSAVVTYATNPSTPAGNYSVHLKADGRGSTLGSGMTNSDAGFVREAFESNNVATTPITLGVDLVLANVALVSTARRTGGGFDIQVSYTVTNTGASSAVGPWYEMAYLSANATLDNADQNLGGSILHAAGTALAPGASLTATTTFSTTSATGPGTYSLFLKTDGRGSQAGGGSANTDSGYLIETNESNNTVMLSVTLQ